MRVLVTGASGVMGRELVAELSARGHPVRALSRRPQPAADGGIAWTRGDLAAGEGLAEAVAGVDAIVHAASDPRHPERVDVLGTRRLLAHARGAGVRHLVYVSIVGTDRIPVPYYRRKAEAEGVVAAGGVPWTIQRATQFHDLLDGYLRRAAAWPALPVPAGFQFQPIDPREVAGLLADLVARGPGGRAPDAGGPQVLGTRELAHRWLRASGRRRLVVPLPLPGRAATALRRGINTTPEQCYGRVTWDEWLTRRYGLIVAGGIEASHEGVTR